MRFEDVAIAFDHPVLEGISFQLPRGETKILMGVAGTGKTLILKLAMGLLKPDSGHIKVLDHDITPDAGGGTVRAAPQYRDGVSGERTLRFADGGRKRRLSPDRRDRGESPRRSTRACWRRCASSNWSTRSSFFPSELSGGMRRRVAIARAIITQPEVLLYDSPTGGLDPVTSNTIIELIVKQRDVYQTSSLMVTHRLQDAFTMASHYFDREQNKMVPVADGDCPRSSYHVPDSSGRQDYLRRDRGGTVALQRSLHSRILELGFPAWRPRPAYALIQPCASACAPSARGPPGVPSTTFSTFCRNSGEFSFSRISLRKG